MSPASTDGAAALSGQGRVVTLAVAWLVMAAPFLLLPELLWPAARIPVALLTLVSCAAAVVLLRNDRVLLVSAAVLGVAATIGWLRAASDETALSHFAGAGLGLLALATVRDWCRTPRRVGLVLLTLVVGGLGLVSRGFFSSSIPTPTKYLTAEYLPQMPLHLPNLERGGLVNPNALGAAAVMVLPLAIALWWAVDDGRWRYVARAIAAVTTIAAAIVLVVTQSRSAWAAAWVGLVLALWRAPWRSRWRTATLTAAVLVPVAAILWIAARIDPSVATPAARMELRLGLWRQAGAAVRQAPLFGIGMNAFRHLPGIPPDIPHAHNVFVQTALDCGLIGLAGYVTLFARVVWRGLRRRRGATTTSVAVGMGSALCIVAAHVFGLADAVALGAKIGLLQWCAAGLVLAAGEQR